MKPVQHSSSVPGRRRGAVAALAAGAALLLLTGACAAGGSGTVYNTDFTAGYDPRSMGAAMSRAPLLVETYGSPAGQPEAEVARSSTLALREHGPAWLPRNYTADAADAGTAPYHLRIAYDLPQTFNRTALCKEDMNGAAIEAARKPGEASSGRTLAAVCRGETALGVAEGAPASSDIGSPAFSAFVGALGRAVMPRRNPVVQDDCLFRRCD